MSVHIVTDSTADIAPATAAELGISVMPCHVYFGDQAYRDGIDLAPQEFFDKLARSSALPRTTQPPVSSFAETYQRLLSNGEGDSVISIHVASTLSGTVNAAWTAAQMQGRPERVEIVDSGQLSMGLGWAAILAARVARDGASAAEARRHVGMILPRLRVAAMIDTLENLHKGGRISQVSALLGTALQIKPLLSVVAGRISVWDRVRTRSNALARLVGFVRDWGPLAEMAVMHTGVEETAHDLAERLHGLVPQGRVVIGPAGAALTTHLGLGAVGVCAVVR